MKFYDCSTAPSPRRVRMFIAEKGLDIPTVQVNLRDQEHLSPAFLKLNPAATVPVLELDDGTALTSTAGCRAYLESVYPEPPLLGRTPAEKGLVADLIGTVERDGLSAVADALRNSARSMKDRAVTGPHNYAQIPELAERGRLRAARFFPALNELIGPKPFMAGDVLTAADIDAFMFIEFVQWVKIPMPEDCQHLMRWQQAMRERPSASV